MLSHNKYTIMSSGQDQLELGRIQERQWTVGGQTDQFAECRQRANRALCSEICEEDLLLAYHFRG